MPAAPIDLDAMFSARIDENLEKGVVIPVKVGGREWHLTNTASHAALLSANRDPMAYVKRLVIPAERDAFVEMLNDIEGMDDDVCIDLINRLTEIIAGEVPTVRPRPSAATSPRRTSGTRSKVT